MPGAVRFAVQDLAIEFCKTMPPNDRLAAAWKDGPKALDLLKQDALYTRQDGEGGWSIPNAKMQFPLAMRLSEIAASCVVAAEHNPVIHEVGMTLFVQHIGPALRANDGFREAALAYREAVIDAKLAPEGWADLGFDPWLKATSRTHAATTMILNEFGFTTARCLALPFAGSVGASNSAVGR